MTDMIIDDEEWLNKQRTDFVLFIDEFDKRREKNFLETFPELEDFYNICRRGIVEPNDKTDSGYYQKLDKYESGLVKL
ncbi:uncharacterized protein METZ01_LOCUS404123 [marine metagenome]|uniref:Uncharacterized protein n=1 Tax=marine metagenome TaxID=408172 RepID=A0A382VXQ5_9ZZZZ